MHNIRKEGCNKISICDPDVESLDDQKLIAVYKNTG